MLSNAYFLAKFRFDTGENEPAKKLQKTFENFEKKTLILLITGTAGRPRPKARELRGRVGRNGGCPAARRARGESFL